MWWIIGAIIWITLMGILLAFVAGAHILDEVWEESNGKMPKVLGHKGIKEEPLP